MYFKYAKHTDMYVEWLYKEMLKNSLVYNLGLTAAIWWWPLLRNSPLMHMDAYIHEWKFKSQFHT